MVSQETLDRLQRARTPKEKKAKQPLAKATKPIPHRSEKMRGVIAALRPLYDKFLKEHTDCEIRTEVCTGQATEVHHVEGRGIKVILDDSKWKSCCRGCHDFLHRNVGMAKDAGLIKSRHKK